MYNEQIDHDFKWSKGMTMWWKRLWQIPCKFQTVKSIGMALD